MSAGTFFLALFIPGVVIYVIQAEPLAPGDAP